MHLYAIIPCILLFVILAQSTHEIEIYCIWKSIRSNDSIDYPDTVYQTLKIINV